MNVMKLTAKGQFTLKKAFLDFLGLRPGDQIIVKKLPGGALKIQAKSNAIALNNLQGCIEVGNSYSDDEIQNAIQQGYAKRGISGLEDEQ